MRIGIDARLYSQTGVGRFIKNLIEQLGIIDKKNEYLIYFGHKEFSSFNPPNNRWRKRSLNIPWHTIKEQLTIPQVLSRDKLDVVHFPYFNVPIFYRGKYLLTIHDLIVDHFDTGRASTQPFFIYKLKRLGYKIIVTRGIMRASHITAISQTTKQEIIHHYSVDSAKITVTYDALDNSFLRMVENKKPRNYFNFPYFIYVGNAYPHKNLERLCQALKIIKLRRKIRLVLVGEDDFFYSRLKKYVSNLKLEDDIVFFGHADNEDLFNLYSFAKCLVTPSLMEGFGLPNLEALICGKLPVVSQIPVFQEIWGETLNYFDPFKVKDIAKNILDVLDLSQVKYQERINQAKTRIVDFSWKKTARQTLELYRKIYNS